MPVFRTDKKTAKVSIPLSVLANAMVNIKHDARATHYNEDILTHTQDVMNRLKHDGYEISPRLEVAVLLHDIGKPLVVTKEKGQIKFKLHETVGSEVARRLLIDATEILENIDPQKRQEVIDDISRLINDHMKMNMAITNALKNKNYKAFRKIMLDYIIDGKGDLFIDLVRLSNADTNQHFPVEKVKKILDALPPKEILDQQRDKRAWLGQWLNEQIKRQFT